MDALKLLTIWSSLNLLDSQGCFQQMQGAGYRSLIPVVKPQASLASQYQDPHQPYHVMCDPDGGQKGQILCYFWVSIVKNGYS